MKCQGCGEDKPDVHRRRQITAYVDEESNFAILCDDCQEESNRYWRDMWNDYYRDCM